jgi:hypothetical protein
VGVDESEAEDGDEGNAVKVIVWYVKAVVASRQENVDLGEGGTGGEGDEGGDGSDGGEGGGGGGGRRGKRGKNKGGDARPYH